MKSKPRRLLAIGIALFYAIPSPTLWAQSISEDLLVKVDKLFSRWNHPASPGCAIGIVRNDSLIFAKGYGNANLEYGVANTPETIFHMASVSKQFTAYAIVLLERSGKLRLDDDIRKHLLWFPDLKEKITIRHLLTHTSGIRDQWQLLAISGTRIDDVIAQDHIIKLLQRQRALNFKPGEQYTYSNSGFTLLAEIVKAVTGQTLRQFADSAIFKPLGMNNTHFHDDYTEVVRNRAYSYRRRGDAQFSNAILSYANAGATSLFTNVKDMASWIMNFYAPRVGDQQDIERLTENGRLNNGKQLTYALGISVADYKGWKQYSHGGSDAGYRTYITVFPELRMGFIVLSNISDFDPGTKLYELADLFLNKKTSIVGTPAASVDNSLAAIADAASLKPFTGNYLSEDGQRFSFLIRDQQLCWDRYWQTDILAKLGENRFASVKNPAVTFEFLPATKTGPAVKQSWPDGERVLVKVDPETSLTVQELQAYTGEYYSPELDCRYAIELKNGGLVLTHLKYPDTKLQLLGRNRLITGHLWMEHLKILRNAKQQITGFEVNDGRVMHLLFKKVK